MSSRTRKLSHELCVDGYIRNWCSVYDIIFPDELIKLIFLLYFIACDTWDVSLGNASDFDFEDENRLGKNNNQGWRVLYGSIKVRNGATQTWKLQRGDNDLKYKHCVIGVINVADTKTDISQNCYFADISQNAHGLDLEAKRLQGPRGYRIHNEIYIEELDINNDIISMTLDMTKDNVTLSYKVNDKDLGVAFHKLDNDKEYCLAISVYWKNDGFRIIE